MKDKFLMLFFALCGFGFRGMADEPKKMEIFFPLNSLYPGMYVHFEWPTDSIKRVVFKAYDGMPCLQIEEDGFRYICLYASIKSEEISDKEREYNTGEPIKRYYVQPRNPRLSKIRVSVYDGWARMRFESYADFSDGQMYYFVVADGGDGEWHLNQFIQGIMRW